MEAFAYPTRHRHRALGSRLALILTLTLMTIVTLLAGAAPAAAGTPASDLYFVYLGGILKYDGVYSELHYFEEPVGRAIGDVAWSLDGRAAAYTVAQLGDYSDSVVYCEWVTNPGPTATRHSIPNASSPAPSPDGSKVACDSWSSSGPTVIIYDAASHSVTRAFPGAFLASWSPDGRFLVFNRNPNDHPINDGFYRYDLLMDIEVKIPVVLPGEKVADSNAWAPRWSPSGNWIVVTKYVNSTGQINVVRLDPNGGNVTAVANVTSYDSFDVRWFYKPSGVDQLYLETTPPSGGRPTISLVTETSVGAILTLVFRDASFGFAASLPLDAPFSDTAFGQPYYWAIASMVSYGIIGGYGDGTFRPSAPVYRAQFAKMAVGALAVAVGEAMTSPFTDLGADDLSDLYPHEYVAAARSAGLTQGVTSTTFAPWDNISRAQMMTMVVRAAQAFAPGRLVAVPAGTALAMNSLNDPTHGANARLAEYNQLLSRIDLTGWDPWGPATRGEVAQMLWNLMGLRGPQSYSTPTTPI